MIPLKDENPTKNRCYLRYIILFICLVVFFLAKRHKIAWGNAPNCWGNEAIYWGNATNCWGKAAFFWVNEAILMGK